MRSALIVLLLLPLAGLADQRTIALTPGQITDITPYVSYLADPDHALSANDAISRLAEFTPVTGEEINFGRTDTRYWLRFAVRNDGPNDHEIVMRAFDGWIKELQVYEIRHGQPTLIYDDALSRPFNQRDPPIRHPAFRVTVEAGAERSYLVNLTNPYVASITMMVGDPGSVRSENDLAVQRFTVFTAIMATLVLINLFYAVLTRQAAFVAYALLQASSAFYCLTLEGFAFPLLWSDSPQLNGYMLFVAAAVCQFFLAIFSLAFLGAANVPPSFYRWLIAITGLAAIHIPLNLLFSPVALAPFSTVITATLSVSLIAYGVLAARNGDISARYYLLGWGLVTAVVFFFGFSVVGFVPVVMAPTISVLAIETVFVVEALCFAFGLAHQYRKLMTANVADRDALIREQSMRLTDAREKMTLEEDKENALREAFDSARRLAVTGHDIAQPLGSLRMALDQLAHDGTQTRLLTSIRNTIEDIEGQVREAIDDSTDLMRRESVSVESVLADVATRFEEAALERGLYLRVFANAGKTTTERLHLVRCLSNLVSNAIHNTTAGGILIAARARSQGLLVQVFDTGTGMTETELNRFRQALEAGDFSSGHGLGLAIVDELCRKHAWQLTLRSNPGRGTCVSVLIAE